METPIEATHRLRREGRWEEASQYRREVRREQRAQGKTKAEAGEIAWQKTIEKFPPLGPGQEAEGADLDDLSQQQLDDVLERTAGQEVDLTGDILWTYENLANTNAVPENAPRMGAWSMLQWARKYQNHFLERLLPKALAAKQKVEQSPEQEMRRLEEADIERIEGRLKGLMEGRQRVFCEKCWRELSQKGGVGKVTVIHDSKKPGVLERVGVTGALLVRACEAAAKVLKEQGLAADHEIWGLLDRALTQAKGG